MIRRSRRGASAMEFAFVAPVVMALVMGIVDYGFLFSQQAQAISAVSGALHAGSKIKPGPNDRDGDCTQCRDVAATHAVMALSNLGYDVARPEARPTITKIADTCALTLDLLVEHESMVGFIPMPDGFRLQLNAPLLHVEGC